MAPYNPPLLTNYAHVKLNNDENSIISKVMGKNGSWFKMFTQNSNLNYVWYNKEHKYVELWGNHYAIEKAKPLLKKRISKFTDI